MTATPRFDPLALHFKTGAGGVVRAMPLIASPPRLISQNPQNLASPVARRTKLWDLSRHLHCSIVGTCLSTGELRQVLGKAGVVIDGASEHDLHGQGVLIAAQHDGAGKLLHKALDKRHRLAINQFEKAQTVEDVRALWREAVRRGDIPGAYWAGLTHPATTDALVREVFGEVHMLSHLVGAANRADIRRLSALEAENAELQEKLRRQQEQLRDGISARDARIRDLGALLARRIADNAGDGAPDETATEQATLARLVGDLERRLATERHRRASVEKRLERIVDELRQEREHRNTAEHREAALRGELEAVEANLASTAATDSETPALPVRLDGLLLLYVGGRPNQVSHLRALTEQLGAKFLQHDGGVEDRTGLLAGLVSRADMVMFPVDCVSHEAVAMVKRLCRQASKPYVPLRSAGLSSFMAALGRSDVTGLRASTAVSVQAAT